MRYLLLINAQENDTDEQLSPEAAVEMSESYAAYTEWLKREGLLRGGERLAPTSLATTVRVRDGQRLITDGPFVETKEALGGYYVIECDDLDRAIDAAARCPGAEAGALEVRPIVEMATPAGAPESSAAGVAG